MGARWIISLRRRTAVGPRGRRGAYRQGSIVRGQSAGPCAKRAEPKLRPGGERSRAPNGLLNPKRSGSSSLGLDLQRSCRDFVPFQGSPPLPDQTGASVSWFRVRVRSAFGRVVGQANEPETPNPPPVCALLGCSWWCSVARGGYSRLHVPFTAVRPRRFPASERP